MSPLNGRIRDNSNAVITPAHGVIAPPVSVVRDSPYANPNGCPGEEIAWYSGKEKIDISDKLDSVELDPEHLRLKRESRRTGAELDASIPGSVTREWRSVLSESANVIDPNLSRAAHADPQLRTFFPLISHGSLQFSRCTRYPWSRDVPSLFRRRDGRFSVIRLWETGESGLREAGVADTASEAVALLSVTLPEDWGPAIEGTADDL